MPNPDAPALNDDDTLKDASELDFVHSPSDESRVISLANRKKRNRSDSLARTPSDTEDDILPGLKDKYPAKKVSGKRIPKLSNRAGAGAAFQSPKSRKFFQSQFIHKYVFLSVNHLSNPVPAVGEKSTVSGKSTTVGEKSTWLLYLCYLLII
jgi:hypothetical protein